MTRVEIPVHFDLWMRGARFGVIVDTGKDKAGEYIKVKMDHPQVKRPIKIRQRDFDYVRYL